MTAPPLRFQERGSGSAIVCIHGWCGRAAFWDGLLAALSNRYRMIAVDLPPEATVEEAAHAIARLIEQLALPGVALIGHSMGGPIGIETAIRIGERCHALIGIDSFTDPRFYLACEAAERAARLSAFRRDFAVTMTAMIEDITAPQTSKALRERITATMLSPSVEQALRSLASLLDYDILDRWPHMSAPAAALNSTLLMGAGDADMAASLGGLDVIALADVGHFPMLEAPGAFTDQLSLVLNRLEI